MTSGSLVATSRRVQLSVGVGHAFLGVVLAIFINHYIGDFPLLLPHKWYDSYWLPLWVACLTYAVEALCVRLPVDWLYGLLITAPAYGWHAGLATVLYLESTRDADGSGYVKVALPAILLALSGGVLNPAIARLMASVKKAAWGRESR